MMAHCSNQQLIDNFFLNRGPRGFPPTAKEREGSANIRKQTHTTMGKEVFKSPKGE